MPGEELERFASFVKTAKGQRHLHKIVEDRLSELLLRLDPEAYPVSEVSAVLGGRNDLIQFHSTGRRVVFELFFSRGQVPQDLRLLEQAEAEVKVAVLLDREIDPRVATQYFRKKPNHFPYLWLSAVISPAHEDFCLARLAELIDEESAIRRVRRIVSDPVGRGLEGPLNEHLRKVEDGLAKRRGQDRKPRIEYNRELVAIRIVAKIHDMDVPVERLRSLYAWLADSETMRYAFMLVVLGFQAFLVTDLNGRHAIWSDADFADDVILGAENREDVSLVVCLNRFVNEVLVEAGSEKNPLRFHFTHAYAEHVREIRWKWDAEGGEKPACEGRSA